MKKYEYLFRERATYLLPTELNKFGKDGWELVSHTSTAVKGLSNILYRHYYTFKRKLPNTHNKEEKS